MEFSRPEYWHRQPFPSPGDLPNPGIKSKVPTLQEDSLPAEPRGKPYCPNRTFIKTELLSSHELAESLVLLTSNEVSKPYIGATPSTLVLKCEDL